MAHGIEARVPFLDHELVEFVQKIPPRLKIRGRQTKYLLRQYAQRLLPMRTTARKKMPFYVPLERTYGAAVFRDMMEDTLADRVVRDRGLFRPEAVAALRTSMRNGDFLYVKQVFSLVMLELWFRMAVDRGAAA